jgi:hypothetical protein
MTSFSRRLGAGLLIALAATLILLANAHLVWVAIRSQPDCLAHVRSDDPDRSAGSYIAAKPSC